jgi:hypothetical protein
VDFKKKLAFAGSNIYWDGFKLTFKEAGYTGPENYYQGVFFKWGSLVGISPAGLEFAEFTTSTPIYTPTFVSTSNKNWSKNTTSSVWLDIVPVRDNVAGDRYSTYLMDDARNTDNDYAYWKAKKGDICRYISENGYGPVEGGVKYGYRMPTLYELGAKNMPNGSYITYSYDGPEGWKKAGMGNDDYSTSGAEGTRVMSSYAFNSVVGTILPASGYLLPNSGLTNCTLSRVGTWGFYWSGSTYDALNPLNLNDGGWALFFFSSSFSFSAVGLDSYGFPVRCVRNN